MARYPDNFIVSGYAQTIEQSFVHFPLPHHCEEKNVSFQDGELAK